MAADSINKLAEDQRCFTFGDLSVDPSLLVLGSVACMRSVEFVGTNWSEVEADAMLFWLAVKERNHLGSFCKTPARRQEWLLGRIAAKSSVMSIASQLFIDAVPGPGEIEVSCDSLGCPTVELVAYRREQPSRSWRVSITHKHQFTLALACLSEAGSPGVDAELLFPSDELMPAAFFSANEKQYLDGIEDTRVRRFEFTRVWSAKEASFKALAGTVPWSEIEIVECDPSSEHIVVAAKNSARFRVSSKLSQCGKFVVSHTFARHTDCLQI